MATKGLKAFALILIVVIGVVFVGAAIWNLIQSAGGGIDLGGLFGGGGDVDGFTAVAFKLKFADGSVQEIRATGPTYSLLPLTLTFEGQELSAISIYVDIDIDTQVPITSWSTKTSLQTEFYKKPETTPKKSSTAVYDYSGGSLSTTGTFTVASTTIQASTLDPIVAEFGDGGWLLQVNAKVDFTAIINGETEVYTASAPSGGVDFTYSGGQTLSITASTRTFPYSINAP